MLTIHEHIKHELGASGPLGTESLIARLDDQCCDPEWLALGSMDRWGAISREDLIRRILNGKREAIRNAIADLIKEGKVSVYSNEPVVSWW